ncbi:beta-glucosidase G [Aspergillus ustus]|uniref:Probable beta-glucosidase G n=1 Tax=Aspergillus ustus TaxID=40382 RepID=A0A0C1E6Q8_ASPUT|nr:beta-glucosidase G [Aspergillus ustus]
MAIVGATALWSLLLLAGPIDAQVYMGSSRSADAFTWVQPLNTTILGQYGHSEPVYPSPLLQALPLTTNITNAAESTGAGGWVEAFEKAQAFVAELTLAEKSDMVTGVPGPCIGNIYPIPRLNFSGICLQDGPVSLRIVDYVSVFPSGVTVAASWDKNVMYERNLAMDYPGQESGNSITDVLYGDVNPSGRLPYTIAYNESDYNAPIVTNIQTTGVEDWQAWFDERLEIDYRYFDANNISVQYEFGYGLSYTSFEMSDLVVESTQQQQSNGSIAQFPSAASTTSAVVTPGGNPELWGTLYTVSITVHNTGMIRGSTVPQLYVTFPDSAPAGTPPRQLRGFEKVELAGGERRTVTFNVMRRDISYWDVGAQEWAVPTGEFVFRVGFSSRDLVASATVTPIAA